MPRYDVRCAACGWTEEVQRGMNQDNPPCARCGGLTETQPPTGTGFVLKGGGWHASLYSKGESK